MAFLIRVWQSTAARRALAAVAVAFLGLAWAPSSHAQALDEAHLVAQGDDAVLQLRFNVRVQYQRHAPLQASDLIEVYFLLLGGDEAMTRPIEETLKVSADLPAPSAAITYPVQTGLPVKKVVIRLGRKVEFKVRAGASNQLLEIVFPGLAPKAAPQVLAPVVAESNRYAISLQTVPLADQSSLTAIPSSLDGYNVFGSRVIKDGAPYYELLLGYFDSAEKAAQVLQSVSRQFPQAQIVDIQARKELNLQQLPAASPESPGAAEAAAAAVAAAPDTDVDKQGKDLMAQARSALISGKPAEAINLLTQLLLLPPNKNSRDAQELIGLARERSGDAGNARKEYELYLKLFPNGDGAVRVRQRLASMAPPDVAKTEAAKPPEKREPAFSLGGSISQSYYGGKQAVQTVFLNVPTTVNQQTISNNVQSSLATTVDLNGRYRTDSSDTRVVFRDSDQYSFISSVAPSVNRMDSAFIDYRNLDNSLTAKVGRQAGVTGGLVGRFDGVVLGYNVAPKLHLNAVAGVPVAQDEFIQASQSFEGVSLEAQNILEHWGGSAFLINQKADGLVDRRAIGTDVRYFDAQKTLFTQLDYDVQFRVLNAATVQGTYQFADQTSLALLLDDRKAPTLTTSNGLLAWGCTSYAQFFAGTCQHAALASGTVANTNISAAPTVDNLRAAALATTANSHQISLDVSRPLGKSWQASFDIRNTAVGALPTVVINNQTFQGSSATGNVTSM